MRLLCCLSVAFCAFAQEARAQTLKNDREQGRIMLAVIKNELRRSYYDPTFRGIDIDARFKKADEEIRRAASLNEVLSLISDVVFEFKDTHTVFLPPRRAARIEYGWEMQLVGDRAFVLAVKPQSDAEAKGLRAGDRILTVDGYRISTRASLFRFHYVYYRLSPKPSVRLVVEKPDGRQQSFNVLSKIYGGKLLTNLRPDAASDIFNLIREDENEWRFRRHRYYELSEDYLIWKMPQFDAPEVIDELLEKARKRKALILDLRGNSGGAVDALQRLVGYCFDRDIKLGDMKGRKETKPLIAKTRGGRVFKGQIVVLIDSESASSAELFARIMQLEKRGVVVGDKTAGAVMVSTQHFYHVGNDYVVEYGLSVTNADILMPDGMSLEGVGVTPDKMILPTAADLATGRDPALASACQQVGLDITPESAGKMFPVEWKPVP